MTNRKKVLVLPGDGIGPEVMYETRRIMKWLEDTGHISFEVEEGLVGGASIDVHNTHLPDADLDQALSSDAILFGAVGGPKWAAVEFERRPEIGILKLRQSLDLFANLRPAIVFSALAHASSLKPDLVTGLNLMIVRELTGGVYFGEPRGIETLPNGDRRAVNTQTYTTTEIVRVARIAFELARKRNGRVCSVEKANVMESGVLWREEVETLQNSEYSDIELTHMYADNAAMQLVRTPKQFDVIVTDNLFGGSLSDCASMLTGSLGMLPSASLGAVDSYGSRRALYEPIHGSAPDIAGTGAANPLAMILSFAMMLRYSFDLGNTADLLESSVSNVLNAGLRTDDIMQEGKSRVTTSEMGDAVLDRLNQENC